MLKSNFHEVYTLTLVIFNKNEKNFNVLIYLKLKEPTKFVISMSTHKIFHINSKFGFSWEMENNLICAFEEIFDSVNKIFI